MSIQVVTATVSKTGWTRTMGGELVNLAHVVSVEVRPSEFAVEAIDVRLYINIGADEPEYFVYHRASSVEECEQARDALWLQLNGGPS